jgi:glycosyltransferase involved in cell wall biosynthesis
MKQPRQQVIAAIPAYNAAKTLSQLLDELIIQKYDKIYVLDDASTDNTVEVVKRYGNKVHLIENDENVGAGANRNRIIGHTADNTIIHFIDADMQLLSKNTPEIIRSIKWYPGLALVGGMVRNPDGTQNPFNFGPRPRLLRSVILGGLQFIIWRVGRANIPLGKFLRNFFNPLLKDFPKIYKSQKERRVYWVAESNMVIKASLFEKIGGYDPRFRYSEIEDLALRLHRKGQHRRFDPRVDAIHASMDNLFNSRKKRYEARKQFYKKHGLLVHVVPTLADYLEGRKTQKRYHK